MWGQVTWEQIGAIAWAQFRTSRNHLPRSSFGSVVMGVLAFLWYAMFAATGVLLALVIGSVALSQLRPWLGVGLLAALLFWQWIPLLSLSGGWSLQLNKLLVYPISTAAFFSLQSILRITTSPEMVFLVLGTTAGLLRNREVPFYSAACLLLYIPFNLFLSLSVNELIVHSFQRNRFRELFAILLVSIGILPQMFLRTSLGARSKPYFVAVANGWGTPWHEIAMLSTGTLSLESVLSTAFWLLAAFFVARWQFAKGLREEDTLGSGAAEAQSSRTRGPILYLLELPSRMFADPVGALVEREIRSLIRMPRFRVVFGMACFFSIVVFFPMAFGNSGHRFFAVNFLPIVNLYGLLLLGDSLLWNIFGFDRAAAQIYFVTPLSMRTVIFAKNLTAVLFMFLQGVVVYVIALAFRFPVTPMKVVTAFSASSVVALFFLSAGNLSSVIVPHGMDPGQTLRKQSGAQIQLWLLGCSLGMFVLVGFAFLAGWALDNEWALVGVLGVEFAIGLIVYRIATDSAVYRSLRDRERILQAISKSSSPIGE